MILKLLQKSRFLRTNYFERWGISWVDQKIDRFREHLHPSETVLDIGAGNCLLAYRLQQQGFAVTPVDVDNLSYSDKIQAQVYDGKDLPFYDEQFTTSLLLTVLHHTHNPDRVLSEAARVSRKIIIIEDVYINPVQRILTYWIDALINLGFSDLPYNHRSDAEWRSTFERLGLKVIDCNYKRVLLFFRQATYILAKNSK